MKCFICHYYKGYGYGAYDEYHYVTFANTEAEALGFCLMSEGHTDAQCWDIWEQEIVAGAVHISSSNQ